MDQNVLLGIFYTILAVVAYGSTYVPSRWFEVADGETSSINTGASGIFFQWLMCVGMFIISVIAYLAVGCPTFYPLCMTGGILFALGNALTIFIMDGLGMAVGSLLWNTVTCIMGWAVSRFGLFGSPLMEPKHNLLNLSGVIIVCIGGCIFAPIKHHPMKLRPAPAQFEKKKAEDNEIHRPTTFKRLLFVSLVVTTSIFSCIGLCILVGSFYGNMLTGINYIVKTKSDASPLLHAHFFAFSVGALSASTVVFFSYSLLKKNRPFTNPELVVPSISAGLIYGVATWSFFAANHYLGQVIAYPIISKSPGIVTSLWAVLLFREIRGKWSIAALISGIVVTIIGVSLISLSKIDF